MHSEAAFGWRFRLPLLMGLALNPINTSIIATALVAIAADFQADAAATASLISVLYLACSIALPVMGKFCDVFGSRRVALSGLVVVAIAGLLGAMAPSFDALIASRVLIGVGTSALYPAGLSLIRDRSQQTGVPAPPGILAAVAIVAQSCIALGLPIGGLLVGAAGWRSVFLVNVPAAALTFVLVLLWIPADGPQRARFNRKLLREIDPVGILFFGAAMAGLVAFLADLVHPAWWLLPLIIVAVVLLALWERRRETPFINVRMLARNPALVRTYLRNIGVGIALYAVLYGLGQWMEHGVGLAPFFAGLMLVPLSAVGAFASLAVGRRVLPRFDAVLAGVSLLVGAVLFITLDASLFVLFVLGITILVGITSGVGASSNQAAMYRQTPPEDLAIAAGLFRTTTYMGGIFAAGTIGWAFVDGPTLAGTHAIGWILAPLAVILVLFGLMDRALGGWRRRERGTA